MNSTSMKLVEVVSVEEWRAWLAAHHATESVAWLVFRKRGSGKASIEYEAAVDEALCFGWVDSLVKRLDEESYARKFTPRKADSKWSTLNRKRYAQLKRDGRLMPAGLKKSPTKRSGDAPRPGLAQIPRYIQDELSANASAAKFFASLAPSYRRLYIAWIDTAKREETKKRRLDEAIRLLASEQKLGLK